MTFYIKPGIKRTGIQTQKSCHVCVCAYLLANFTILFHGMNLLVPEELNTSLWNIALGSKLCR